MRFAVRRYCGFRFVSVAILWPGATDINSLQPVAVTLVRWMYPEDLRDEVDVVLSLLMVFGVVPQQIG